MLNRNYLQLFPSIFLTRKITKDISTNIQYVRRVNRPSYQQQKSFIEYLDSLTYTKGNPLIRPEISDQFKIGLTYQNQPFFSISHNKTTDVIFENAPKQDGNLTFTTPENLAQFNNVVFELNFPLNIGKKLLVLEAINLFGIVIKPIISEKCMIEKNGTGKHISKLHTSLALIGILRSLGFIQLHFLMNLLLLAN